MKTKVDVFDTTLRDGEQAAGSRLDVRQKLEIARQLARLNVDIIEAGYPNSSPKDFEAVQLLSREIKGVTICGLSRAILADIDKCGEALADAERARIHTGIGVSDVHIAGKFGNDKYGTSMAKKKARLIEMAVAAVRHAKSFTHDVEFYAEDSGRAEPLYLFDMLTAVVDAGATVLNIPDTTGYAVPEQYGALIRSITENVKGVEKAIISVHCHDDLGMAVANSLAGVKNGARQVEGTINGIGERAGNAAIEEIVMALRTRSDYFGADTQVKTNEFYRVSRMVADAFTMTVPPNKAIVGDNAFAHSSGIHVDGVLKMRETYEIMSPEDVGFDESRVVLTARTGRHGLLHRLEKMGYTLAEAEVEQVYKRFLEVADKKREVFDGDLAAIVHDEIRPVPTVFALEYLNTIGGTGTIPTAAVRVRHGDREIQEAACGDGPIDAAYRALAIATGMSPTLTHFEIRAVSSGTEGMGEVNVRLQQDGTVVSGRGASTDIIEASAKAYIDGLNKLVAEKPGK
ncbi:MAG: 2-isopropylmalate synthase [Verrucomicrobia bacterium]|nr:2-isopropylmalate synthase [Verrucomicrobiota bacterium]